MAYRRVGMTGAFDSFLSMFPSCQDPTRPLSWISPCDPNAGPSVGTTPPPALAPPGAPQTVAEMTIPGVFTPEMSAQESQQATLQSLADYYKSLNVPAPPGPPDETPWYCKYLGIGCDSASGLPGWAWGAIAVVGGVLVVNVVQGRRR